LILEKCPDPNALVEITVRSVLISSNASGAETISMASCEYDSGPESEFDFGDMQSSTNGEDTTTGPGRASRILKRPQRGQSSTNRNVVV